jgi:periplasmic divalent cation tolerance protein
MVESNYLVVLITVGNTDEASRIADALVSQRKAACVNIVPRISSVFRWEGKIESEQESLLLVKTRAELFPAVVDLIKRIHSYDVPEIIALPIIGGNEDYLTWLGEETQAK